MQITRQKLDYSVISCVWHDRKSRYFCYEAASTMWIKIDLILMLNLLTVTERPVSQQTLPNIMLQKLVIKTAFRQHMLQLLCTIYNCLYIQVWVNIYIQPLFSKQLVHKVHVNVTYTTVDYRSWIIMQQTWLTFITLIQIFFKLLRLKMRMHLVSFHDSSFSVKYEWSLWFRK